MARKENKKVEVNGKTYELQHPGVKWCWELSDRCTDPRTGNLLRTKYAEELFRHVVVDPDNLKLDDECFDNAHEPTELVQKIEDYL